MRLLSFAINALSLRAMRLKLAKRSFLKSGQPIHEMFVKDWASSLDDPSRFYIDCFRYFHLRLPAYLKEHRKYFSINKRGFGEDAFHVMWLMLFHEFKPKRFLEIGVYRGQTLSLISLLQRDAGFEGEIVGLSPFLPAGDKVSSYLNDIDYLEDTLKNFQHFKLPAPTLFKAFSTDPQAIEMIQSKPWDCIYIDGNHDYEVVRADWKVCSKSVRSGGIVVLDDSGLTTSYKPPIFSTAGHPGPSQIASEIDRTKFREILQVGHNRVFQKIEPA